MLKKKWRKLETMLTPRRSYGKDLSKGKFTGENIFQSVISTKLHTSKWIFSCKSTEYFQNVFL